MMQKPALLFFTILVAFLTDQVSKYWIVNIANIDDLGARAVFPPYLNFVYVENRGINFGLFGGDAEARKWILIIVMLAICFAVLLWSRHSRKALTIISAGLLIGGALGNVFDRVVHGAVIDFINNSCCGFQNPFAYNIADIWIFAGAIGLMIWPPQEA